MSKNNDNRRPVLYDQNLNFFRNLVLQARLVWLLLRDSRVPLWLKALPLGSAIYLFSPIDIVTDFAPVLGQIDDLMIVLAGLTTFVSLCPVDVVEEHMASLTGRADKWEVNQTDKPATPAPDPDSPVVDGDYTESPEESK